MKFFTLATLVLGLVNGTLKAEETPSGGIWRKIVLNDLLSDPSEE